MHEQLVEMLVGSGNEAADDVLLEGLRTGVEIEQRVILKALLNRKSIRGLSGIVQQFEQMPDRLRTEVLANIKALYPALRECGRSDRLELRVAALKLIGLSRQGRLGYVLSDNLHHPDPTVSGTAVEAVVSLTKWIADTTRELHVRGGSAEPGDSQLTGEIAGGSKAAQDSAELCREVLEQRTEMEAALARALDLHRGPHAPELLRAALILCDWPGSKTLVVLQTAKHGGQTAMVRKLQQPPTAEHVAAFLIGATHGQLRAHFGSVFSRITDPDVLDGILAKTHWLKDQQLLFCMHQVTRGVWWQEGDMLRDLESRSSTQAWQIGEWLAASGMHDLMQDERLTRLAEHAREDFGARLRILRIASRRKKGGSTQIFRRLLDDRDERIVRLSAREMLRRRPADAENTLFQLMTSAPDSVRRVVGRALGQSGFDNYWNRFDRLEKPTRQQAGKAMLKLLPDAVQRLGRKVSSGSVDQRLKALQIVQELGVVEPLRDLLIPLLSHAHSKIRSKAVSVLGELASPAVDVLMERMMDDTDARVRANAIEALEARSSSELLPALARRAKSPHNRERANAIKSLHRMKIGQIGPQLLSMLRDDRPEHRISGMWALRQMGLWKLLTEVGRLARQDPNLRVRRYALALLRSVAELVQTAQRDAMVLPPPAADNLPPAKAG